MFIKIASETQNMYCGIVDVDIEVTMRLYTVSPNRKCRGNDHITHNMPTTIDMNCFLQINLLPCVGTLAQKAITTLIAYHAFLSLTSQLLK